MTRTFQISGQPGFARNILRTVFIAAATVGGLFVIAASAAFAFFIAVGLLLLGGLTFAFFWGRAKLFGRPFGPQAHFAKARADMEAQLRGQSEPMGDNPNEGPIIDAHQTPNGWSVDD